MLEIETNVPLKKFTTFRIGGNAEYFCRVRSVEELQQAFIWSNTQQKPVFILGEGSNILISDNGFSGLVIKIELKGIYFKEQSDDIVYVIAAAGESWDDLVEEIVKRDLYGAENLSNIPGTVGATPIQNIGAYGIEVKEIIEWVEVLDSKTMQSVVLYNDDCNFKYRNSIFKTDEGRAFVVTKVCYKLKRKKTLNTSYKDITLYFEKKNKKELTLRDIREAIIDIRKQKSPDLCVTGTAGSFFKNPIVSKKEAEELQKKFKELPLYFLEDGKVKVSLAWLLDHGCNWKGIRRGNVGVFDKQPLILVNYGEGNAQEIKTLADEIIKDIKDKTGITLELEVTCV